jgi:hypothetical protein
VSWFRVDDKAAFHRKVLKAGNEAFGALVRMGCWASDHLTDGHIPRETAELIAPPQVIAILCLQGFLEPLQNDFVIHDFLDYNPSAAEVEELRAERREAKAKAGKAGGLASGRSRRSKNEAVCFPSASVLLEANAKQNEAPSRSHPDPIKALSLPRAKPPDQLWLEAVGLQPGAGLLDAWLLAKNAAPAKGLSPEEYFSKALGAFVAWVDGVRADRRPQKSPQKFVEHFSRIQEILDGKREAVPAETPSTARNAPLAPMPAATESKTETL